MVPWPLCSHFSVTKRVLCAFLLLFGSRLGYAQELPETPERPALPSADPNGAEYSVEYRGAARGRFSDSFALYGGEGRAGYALSLAPLFELHEPRRSQNVLPSQYWRARLSLAQSYGWARNEYLVRAGVLLTHESDHETAHAYSRPGFLALNDLAARVQVTGLHAQWTWYAVADAQLYFLSCTQPSRDCENFRGDQSFGGQLQAGAAWTRFRLWGFSPFVAASLSGIVAHGVVIQERRLLARLGAYTRLKDSMLSLFALGSLGSDVGIVRNRTLNVVGVGASFAR